MRDGSPGTRLVVATPYGPLHGLAVRVNDMSSAGRYEQAIVDIDEYHFIAELFGDGRTVDFLVQLRMYMYLNTDQHEPALAVGERLLARHRAAGNVLGEAKT